MNFGNVVAGVINESYVIRFVPAIIEPVFAARWCNRASPFVDDHGENDFSVGFTLLSILGL